MNLKPSKLFCVLSIGVCLPGFYNWGCLPRDNVAVLKSSKHVPCYIFVQTKFVSSSEKMPQVA